MKSTFVFILFLAQFWTMAWGQGSSRTLLFVGSYTDGKPDLGIYVYEFNATTGELSLRSQSDSITNPSYVTLSPNGSFLYACTDTKLPHEGTITAFKIDSINGTIVRINQQPSGGANPVYLSVDKGNRFIVNGNYTDGNVTVFTTNEDGSLNPYVQRIQFVDSSIMKTRQEKAHIHATVFSPDFDFVFLPDLGSDKIRVFTFDTSLSKPLVPRSQFTVHSVLGSGPRHFTFHPSGTFAYCIEELSGTVAAYSYDTGKLDSIQRIFSYSKKQESYGSSDIHISPDGLFLYASNRWDEENTLSIFSIHQHTGKLSLVAHQSTYGDHPRNFTLDPSGKFLLVANQVTGNVVVFERDVVTGLLRKTQFEIQVPSPSCLQMRTYRME